MDPHGENKNKSQNPNPQVYIETRGFLKASADCIFSVFTHSELCVSSAGAYHGSFHSSRGLTKAVFVF